LRRPPCKTCPWRTDKDASTIPNFSLALAEGLASTCPDERDMGPDFGAPMFACHQSKDGDEIVCAGWLATQGHRHPSARLMVSMGQWDRDALDEPAPDWPELHGSFIEVIEKLRRTA
jgi:hypothetical protein